MFEQAEYRQPLLMFEQAEYRQPLLFAVDRNRVNRGVKFSEITKQRYTYYLV
jgi:hypothetical protein